MAIPTHRIVAPEAMRDFATLSNQADDRLLQATTERQLLDAIAQVRRAIDTLQGNRHELAEVEKIASALEALGPYLRATQGVKRPGSEL